jgi:hypothetical protein
VPWDPWQRPVSSSQCGVSVYTLICSIADCWCARALEPGPRRDHFLALATPDYVAERKEWDKIFQPADYGKPYSLLASYSPSAAWAWMVCDEETPGIIGFNDI